jgi:hypothetical protein
MEVNGPARPASRPASIGLRCSCLLLIGLLAAWVVMRLGPPAAVPRDAPADVFSAGRAREHLERIARVPHPSGSAAARDVEAYISRVLGSLGLEVELQAGPACTEAAGLRRCGHVRNVIGTWRGRVHDGALLLSAHYDSVPNAPGAGDDGAAVAALLEAARVVSRWGQLEHDVIFAFLDGEEDLLLGSNQLCFTPRLSTPEPRSGAPLRSRVRLVGNFDARGSSGAVTLISATSGSAGAITELASALEHPVLSSFYPSVARVLPNATDAEVYERCGLETLSFAFAAGFENYHQGTDTPAHLDDRSLQHHGDHALALLRRFAEGAFAARDPGAEGLVFFDVGALFVLHYPYALARVLAAALALAAVVVVRRRLRALGLSLPGLILAAAAFALACLVALGMGALVVGVVTRGWRPWASYVHAAGLGACAACFVLAAVVPLAAWARRRFAPELLTLGALLVWVGLALTSAVALPGMSQLFTWPGAGLLGAVLVESRLLGQGLLGQGLLGERHALAASAGRALALVPAVLMITPVIYTLLVVLGAPGVAAAMACGVAVLGAGPEPLELLTLRPRPTAAALLALGLLGAVGLTVHVRGEPGPPTPNVIAYSVDAEAGRAAWASPDASRDAFTAQFLGPTPLLGSIPALGSERLVWMNTAPVAPLEPPTLELVSDRWAQGERSIELRVRSPRVARSVLLWENTAVSFSDYRFDGAAPLPIVRFSPELDQTLLRLLTGLGDRARWSITLFSPHEEGSKLTLFTRHAGALEFQIADRSEGLAVLPVGFVPRSTEWTEGYPGDHTLVSGPRLVVEARPAPAP